MIEREPTPHELAVFKKYEKAIFNGRTAMDGFLGAAACMGMIEKWRLNQVKTGMIPADFFPVMFSAARIEEAKKRAAAWNILENGLAGLISRKFGFQVRPNKAGQPDIDIFMRSEPALGALPVVLLVIGASVVIGGILTALALRNSNLKDARDMKKELAFLNQRMAAAPPPVRDAFRQLQNSKDYKQQKTLWDSIKEGITGALTVGLLAIAGAYLLRSRDQKAANRSPVPNPCGGTAPEDWNVSWSKDPEKAQRQLEYVLDSLSDRSLADRWQDYWDVGYYEDDADEVPF